MAVQDRPGRGDRPAIMRLGHYSTHLLAGVIAVTIADDALGRPAGVMSGLIGAAWCVWAVSMAADAGYHVHRLCERCIAASPLDPQAAVARWKAALRVHHSKPLMIGALLAVLGWFLLDGRIRHWSWWALGADAVAVTLIGLVNVADYKHRRLYPWCPWCHWGDGGSEEVSPDVPVVPVSR